MRRHESSLSIASSRHIRFVEYICQRGTRCQRFVGRQARMRRRPKRSAQAASERFNAIADREARDFQVSYADDLTPFELVLEPLLVWTNPVSGSIRGRVYLWTHQGIPVLIASVYKYDNQRQVSSEFHALARRPITGKSGSGEMWKIESASAEFKSIPNTASPAASRSARLAQMRDIARRFTASRTDPNKSNWDLRLLARASVPLPRQDRKPC